MTSRRITIRVSALHEAVALHTGRTQSPHHGWLTDDVLTTADRFYNWLTEPPPVTGAEILAGTPIPKGTTMTFVMPDNDALPLSIAALDAEKVVIPGATFTDPAGVFVAPFSWTVSDTTIGQVTVAPDTLSASFESLVGVVGTVSVTVTDANGKAMAPFAIEIDPSAAVTAGIVAGALVPRTDAPAPAPAAPATEPAPAPASTEAGA